MIDIPENAIICGMCGAVLWIATPPDGKHHLMRLSDGDNGCLVCLKMQEMVK